jgi:hypothetical protein
MTYLEACKPSLLENIANGKYWHVGHDYRGRPYDPRALQQAKARVVLDELNAQIAQIPDPETLPETHMGDGSKVDAQAKIMMLQIKTEARFHESITKTMDVPQSQPQPQPAPVPAFEPAVTPPVLEPSDTEKQAIAGLRFDLDARFSPKAIAERVAAIEREAQELREMRDPSA